jgi:hypothetical protein
MASMVEMPDGDVVIVYDAQTGAIRHIHEEVTLAGAKAITRTELTKKATTLARSLSAPDGSLATLVTTGKELQGKRRLRVDVATRKLVTVRAPRLVQPPAR